MNEIIVAGIGPGHPDYMLPAAARAIREAQVLVGGRRALSQFARKGQRTISLRSCSSSARRSRHHPSW